MSVTGCGHKTAAPQFCSAGDSGPQVGQVATITISQSLATIGESLNYGQIGQSLSASASDCKGSAVSVSSFTYASSDLSIADINPATGQVCAGTWNRFTGGGVPDFTFCTPPATPSSTKFVAYVTATAAGATSNQVPVYVHPVVTSVELAVPQTTCSATDPTSNCCPANATTAGVPGYDLVSCVSQNKSAQLAAKVFAGGGSGSLGTNITCQVGHISFTPQGATNIVTIDQSTGIATANQPGSATITATIANNGSGNTAGFFSACPPASIALTAPGNPGANISVPINNLQPFSAEVKDTNGNVITGLSLEFNTTSPRILPTGSSSATPSFPGTATVTAVCQPPSCNPSPFSEIGFDGNGQPLTSNGITVTATGTSSSVIYAGSTSSQYIYPLDFTTGQPPSLVKLPYPPNSMVISEDGSAIYLGSSFGMMTYTTANNGVSAANVLVPGTVLAISPDNSTIVVTDTIRQTVSLVSSAGGVLATYGGVGTAAQFSPDSQTVYITTGTANQLLVHSAYLGWKSITTSEAYNDVAVVVPHIGAYFAGPTHSEGRSYCASTQLGAGTPPVTINTFYPTADVTPPANDHITATTDGAHILGAIAGSPAVLNDTHFTPPTQTVTTTSGTTVTTIAACPLPTQTQIGPGYFVSSSTPHPLTGIAANTINGVVAASNSSVAFVTYNGTSGLLPLYVPSTGALSFVTLSGGATSAPVSGAFSTDNLTFYTGTSGDNKIHLITIKGTTATDSSTLSPNLPDVNGNIVAPNLLVQRPKRTTS
ncbi:MAG TPA: hypothetical protein VGN16_23915 [Acidobacteriaceae bacterium]|jgi:hypothetical protein